MDVPGSAHAEPVLTADQKTLYTAYFTATAASGTTKSKPVVRVVALATETGKTLWQCDTSVPDDLDTSTPGLTVTDTGDLLADPDPKSDTDPIVAIDPTQHRARWSATIGSPKSFGNVVLGLSSSTDGKYPQLAGWDLRTGKQLWGGDPANVDSSILDFKAVLLPTNDLLISKTPYSGGSPHVDRTDMASGKVLKQYGDVELSRPQLVGGNLLDLDFFQDRITAYDPSTFAVAWTLPTPERSAPSQPFIAMDTVYGRVDDNKSVALNPITGVDLGKPIDGAIIDVNQYGALLSRGDKVLFVPATD